MTRERNPCPIEAELIIATLEILETPLIVLISKRVPQKRQARAQGPKVFQIYSVD